MVKDVEDNGLTDAQEKEFDELEESTKKPAAKMSTAKKSVKATVEEVSTPQQKQHHEMMAAKKKRKAAKETKTDVEDDGLTDAQQKEFDALEESPADKEYFALNAREESAEATFEE